ncbi:MAG: flagellar biosynthetic protein FliO [Syntrophobacteraceae bacterium]|jgi:flagellar biosynthetic protein FliO|nr:flagellar biosynthetic protein FliO [Syntrophobacteraceae bacterium]
MEDGLNFGLQLAKTLGGLAVVLAVLVACTLGLKKTGLWIRRPETEPWIRVLAQRAIGVKHQVVLLKVQDRTLLVGVSPQGISLLTQFEEEARDSAAAPSVTMSSPHESSQTQQPL